MEKEKKSQEQSLIFLNKYYKAIIFGIALVILAGGYLLIIGKDISALKQKRLMLASEKAQELGHAASYFKKLEELNKTIDSFQKENRVVLTKLEQVLPKSSQIPDLIAQVEALVKASGFSLDSFAFAEGESAAKKSSASRSRPISETDDGVENIGGAETAQKSEPAAKALSPEVKSLKLTLTVSGNDYCTFKEL